MDDDDDEQRELHRLEQTTREVMLRILAIIDGVMPPENGRALLVGVASKLLSRHILDGEDHHVAAVNAAWAEENFPWRMVKSLQ